ncbi:UDP-N-acetylgalactosamine-undecaprenyl-phosphate N-acetylgalactosaminephosphotransferase [Planctomycetes bacterium CA13]|uniref:UDP-N-acetylgalactosamine-undecaprenyl-phosphate N-acetylgalactosaminephosphotransferase n=1 Tax=Novipirellula herctigrandis TaxID=2527986 RepID=A0A5C5Z7D3_9BACT|nr:UDP-N-acetylgalactosamine-undecaprenyl-phosphate N-acetylgalactosaminephosphotransferase [Planctomycetes bacterium CA13]
MIQGLSTPTEPSPTSWNLRSDFYVHPSLIRSTSRSSDEINIAPPEPSHYFQIKSVTDRLLSVGILTFALPVMSVVALAILICDGRPIFFRQVRVGKKGSLYQIWKFRTMQRNAEKGTGAVWSHTADARVTPLGRWLRCSHLDELPQLFNVLAGNMNLVGPRPERPEFVERLAEELPNYLERTQVKPGITGLAQLRLGYDESLAGIPEKIAHDMKYIHSASLLVDIRLLVVTLPHVIRQVWLKVASNRQRVVGTSSGHQQEKAITTIEKRKRPMTPPTVRTQPIRATSLTPQEVA